MGKLSKTLTILGGAVLAGVAYSLWKDKKAIVIYTIGGSEWFNLLNLNLGYRVLKYPLNLVGISNIKKFYIDQLNRSNKQSVNKKVNSLVEKVMKSI